MGDLVTGAKCTVTHIHDADLFQGIFGSGRYVLATGNACAASIVDNNTVRIADGVIVSQGRRIQIKANTADDFVIETGAQNATRYDIIGYHIYSDAGQEHVETFVLKDAGESVNIPEQSLRDGADNTYISMYRVKLEGLTITELIPLYEKVAPLTEMSGSDKEFESQVVSFTDKITLESSAYFNLKSSRLTYNKLTGEVVINLCGISKQSFSTGESFLIGYLDSKFLPTDMNIAVAMSASQESSGGAAGIIYSKDNSDATKIRGTAIRAIGSGYYIYASAHYYIEPGLV